LPINIATLLFFGAEAQRGLWLPYSSGF